MQTELIFTFHNTHHAIAGEQALLSGGIAVRVMPMPSAISAGCGLCLRVNPNDRAKAEALFAQKNVEVQQAYLAENGAFTAV